MQFALTEDQIAVRDMARDFAAEKIAPHALKWDEEKFFPVDVMREAAALGMGGIYIRDDVGGSALTRFDAALIFEALATGCPTVSSFISIHNMASWMIDRFGSDAQRHKWLPRLCTMELIASYALTEPGAGSDAAALSARAVLDGDHYVLNGQKQFISGAGTSDIYVAMVRTGGEGAGGVSTLVIDRDTPGVSFGANERKMGWNAQPTRAVIFENARVPVANRLGEEGIGFKIAMAGLDGGRLNIAACSLGGAQSALDKSLAYMQERKAFGNASTNFRRCSSALPTWRPNWKRRVHSCGVRRRRWTARTPMPRCSAPWPSASAPMQVSRSPIRRCNCTAATVISPNMASKKSSGICACIKFLKEPTKSCGSLCRAS